MNTARSTGGAGRASIIGMLLLSMDSARQNNSKSMKIHRYTDCADASAEFMNRRSTSMDELKLCPFCGHKAAIQRYENPNDGRFRYFSTCLVCWVETPRIARTVKEAESAWNRRAGDG
jgi:Lar family restriction alleviation protein